MTKELLDGLYYEVGIRPAGWLCERANGEALKAAISRSDKYCVALGEDETVSKDFLEVLETISQQNNDLRLFSVSCSGLGNIQEIKGELNGAHILIKSRLFINLGCAIFKEPFEKHVKQYINERFYQSEFVHDNGTRMVNPTYVINTFPEYAKLSWFGVDGLVQRAVLKHDLYTLLTATNRSHEIGFQGAHIFTDKIAYDKLLNNKSLEEKVKIMRDLISSGKIREYFGDWAYKYQELEDDHELTKLDVYDAKFDFDTWQLLIGVKDV